MKLEDQYIALRHAGASPIEARVQLGLCRSAADRFSSRYACEQTGGRDTYWPSLKANNDHVSAVLAERRIGFGRWAA